MVVSDNGLSPGRCQAIIWTNAGKVLIKTLGTNFSAPQDRSSTQLLLSGEPDYFGRNKISSGGDLSHYSSASLY